jgi:hypothetical protein
VKHRIENVLESMPSPTSATGIPEVICSHELFKPKSRVSQSLSLATLKPTRSFVSIKPSHISSERSDHNFDEQPTNFVRSYQPPQLESTSDVQSENPSINLAQKIKKIFRARRAAKLNAEREKEVLKVH